MAGETVTGDPFLRDLWYMPALAAKLSPGDMRREMLLGEPVLLGRNHGGEVFALRDICPHRGVPLSAGRIKPDNSVECPYHGWRFRKDGVCSAIPSLVPGQDFDPEKDQGAKLCRARAGRTDLGLYAARHRALRPNPNRRAPVSATRCAGRKRKPSAAASTMR